MANGELLKFSNLISLKPDLITVAQKFPDLGGMLISFGILGLPNTIRSLPKISALNKTFK